MEYFKKYFDVDVEVEKTNSTKSVNRTLMTDNEEGNINLWMDAGYSDVPTIEENIKELIQKKLIKENAKELAEELAKDLSREFTK